MRRTLTGLGVLAAVVLISYSTVRAQEIPSAQELLKKTTELAEGAPVFVEPETGSRADFEARVATLAKEVGTLPAAEAARRWLALFDEEAKLSDDESLEDENYQLMLQNRALQLGGDFQIGSGSSTLMEALPPPAAWQELSQQIDARPLPEEKSAKLRETSLRFLGHLLLNDKAWLSEHLAELKTAAGVDADITNPELAGMEQSVSLETVLLGAPENPADVSKQFTTSLDMAEKSEWQRDVQVPDLVTLVGAEQAEQLLRAALVLNVRLQVEVGDETRTLAQKLAVELIDQLRKPQWGLVTVNSVDLYEKLEAKFAPAGPAQTPNLLQRLLGGDSSVSISNDDDSWQRQEAKSNYILGLVVKGRADDVVKHLKSGDETRLSIYGLEQLDDQGFTRQVYQTVHTILTDNPDLPLWDLYASLAARTGNTAAMLELARQSAAREGLTDAQRQTIRDQMIVALLADDRAAEAAPLLEAMIVDEELGNSERLAASLRLARIGRQLKNDAWMTNGIASLVKFGSQSPAQTDYSYSYMLASIVSELSDAGRYAEALNLIGEHLKPRVPAKDDRFGMNDLKDQEDTKLMFMATQVYHKAGRHADVLYLLIEAPSWGQADLKELYKESGDSYPKQGISLGEIAAAALIDAGRNDEARKILHAVLDAEGNSDYAYELLVKIDGANAIPKFDELFARDRFQERPLIWKAHILLTQNNLVEAERIAREAISIDPSDGEQGRGDRMRVYAVLADILEKKGDAENTKFFREVVASIRMSEDADQLYEAGLLKRAIALYEEALTHFQDAYCIQSRLALRLSEMGLHDLAEAHYRKAYELMPDSFGRVESHCFGCERAFAGTQAQSIAESVFTKFILEQPNKPQVHYLLGYLRENQGRHREAMESFQRAVKLDPDYLNAWKHLLSAGEHVSLPQDLKDEAQLAMLRLDPLRRHGYSDVSGVLMLAKLWETAESVQKFRVPEPGDLLELTASKKKIEAGVGDRSNYYDHAGFSRGELPTPAAAVAGTRAVTLLRSLMVVDEE